MTGTAKHPYIDLGLGPAGSNAITQPTHQLEGIPHKNLKKQDFPKIKATSFLLSAELLMCSRHSWFPKKNRLSPRFPKRIASADHFLSPKSPAFCKNGRCRHVLSCGPRFERFYCFGESSCTLLAVLRTRLQSVFVGLVTLRSLLSCSQGLVRRTLCVREAPTRSRTSQKMKATSSLSAELLLCNFLSCFALKSQLLQDVQNALPLLATFCRQSLQHFATMAVAAMCSAVAPALTGFVFAWEKRSAHYWQTFAVHFHRLVTLKPYFPICNQSGPCQRNP